MSNKTFIGCDSEFDEANIVLLGVAFDATSTYRKGSRLGPTAIRQESHGIETYSPYQDKDLDELKVCDIGDLDVGDDTEAMLEKTEKLMDRILYEEKFPVMLGGEHLVTLGAVRAAIKVHPKLCIVHFDAHTDLRDDWEGLPYNHSTVMRRCFDVVGKARIFQFGIRSGERSEFEFAKKNTKLAKNNFEGLENALYQIGGRPVYFTVDMDVLDPSEFGGTGTPEAGGVRFLELLDAARRVFKLNVVGCDIVELSPPYDTNGASTALACKFLREVLLMVKHNKKSKHKDKKEKIDKKSKKDEAEQNETEQNEKEQDETEITETPTTEIQAAETEQNIAQPEQNPAEANITEAVQQEAYPPQVNQPEISQPQVNQAEPAPVDYNQTGMTPTETYQPQPNQMGNMTETNGNIGGTENGGQNPWNQ